MSRARTVCSQAVCLNLQPCADHPPRPAWDHGGRSRQARGLDAEYDRNRAIVLREETHCGICGEPGLEDDTADHKVPRAQGGGNERSNLQRAHRECNQRKGGAARC